MEHSASSEDSRGSSTSPRNGEILIDLTTQDVRDSPSSFGLVASGDEDEQQSDSETEVNEDADDDTDEEEATKAEGSIHRLCIGKLQKLLPNTENSTEEEMIDALVKSFNEKKKTTGNFELEPANGPEPELLCNVLSQENFHIRLYVSQRRGSIPPILKWYGSRRKCGPIHLVWFFYRPGEIFAFTTNQGYRLVHDCSEFDFPNKTAARLCTDEVFRVRKQRLLVGQDWEESKVTKNSERPSASDLPSVYSTFTSELRQNASIRGVTNFSIPSVKVEFKACSLRFVSKLNIMDLPKILNHLSTIAKGLPTFTYMPLRNTEEPEGRTDSQNSPETPMLEISNSVYDSFLVAVKNEELYNELERELVNTFRQAVALRNFQDFSFDLGYKHHKDFAMATKVELIRKLKQRREPVLLSLSPSLQEILPYLLLDYELSRDVSYAKRVLKDKVRIRFTTSTNKSKDDSLLSFLEGELFYKNKIYWRSRNLWFEPMDSYVATADKIFIEFLQQHYLKPEMPNHLIREFPKPKFSKLQKSQNNYVEEYTKKYQELSEYFLPLSTSQPVLFDLMYIDKEGKIWIYFIAYNFLAHTTKLCARLKNCLEAIKAACESQTGSFRIFYDELEPQRRVRLGVSFDVFQSRLKESQLVYALAASPVPVSAGRFWSVALGQEKDRRVRITQDVLQAALHHVESGELQSALARTIHGKLLNEGYIDNNDMATTKFLYCTELTFNGTGLGSEMMRAAVYEVLTRFQSGFKSLRARFELRYIARKAVYSTKFVIQDICGCDTGMNVKK